MTRAAQLFALAIVASVFAACGGGGEGSSATTVSGSTVHFEADPSGELAYTEDEITAKAGKVTIAFKNPQSTPHVVKVEDSRGHTVAETALIAADSTAVRADLKPGAYTFFCSVPGHRKAGMEGTLTMK